MIKDLSKALITVLILACVAFVLNGCGQKTETANIDIRAGVVAELDECLIDAMRK